jgi:putative aldouronate transport system permease protein
MQAAITGNKRNKSFITNFVHSIKYYNFLYIVLILSIVYFLIFKIRPILNTIYFSLVEYDFQGAHTFVGFDNFRKVFAMSDYWRAFRNTLILNFYGLIFAIPVPIILSLLLNELLSNFFKKVVQTIIIIPHFISWVVVSGIFVLLLSPTSGPVNTLIKALGADPVFFFGDNRFFRGVLIFSGMWRNSGYGTVVYLAAISGIPTEMYESAVLDGASRFRQIWHITLPSIKDTIFAVYMLSMAAAFLGSEQVFIMYNSTVYETADILSTLSFRMGLQQLDYGNSTAISFCSSFISFILFQLSNFMSKKLVGNKLL